MPGLQVAIPERMGRRAHLPPVQVDCGLAEWRGQQNALVLPRAHPDAQFGVHPKPREFCPQARNHRAEPTTPLMTTYQRADTRTFSPRSSRSTSKSTRPRPDQGVNAKARYAKYVELARASALTGDAVETENYYQHAEHYFRVMREPTE